MKEFLVYTFIVGSITGIIPGLMVALVNYLF